MTWDHQGGRVTTILILLNEALFFSIFTVKQSVHLSRSNGYRELGMFDESILELEAIDGNDRWHPLVLEARYNTYRDAKESELAKTMAEVMVNRMPDKFEWLKNQVDAMTECGDPTGALELLHDSSKRLSKWSTQTTEP